MTDATQRLLVKFEGNEAGSSEALDLIEEAYGIRLPADYRDFILERNGGEGFVGIHYLVLWRVEEIVRFNQEYQVGDYAPGILLFGTSGGGEGFGFDTRSVDLPIVQVPFVGLDLRHAKVVARSLTDLLLRMRRSNGSLL